MSTEIEPLTPDLVERVLTRLGFSHRPEPTLEGLRGLYASWCQKVPFDNIQKLIHLRAEDPRPLPGQAAAPFFEDWLRDGTGGTCCAVTGGLHALLSALGFEARRALAAMLLTPKSPINHGLAYVVIDGARYALDATMLHAEPFRLDADGPTEVAHPAWGVKCRPENGRWILRFRPMLKPDGLDCRIETMEATRAAFNAMYEGSRPWSPFNFELSARLNRGDSVVGTAFGRRIEFTGDGKVLREPLRPEARVRFMVEELGISESLAARVPPDRMTPPPPRGFAG